MEPCNSSMIRLCSKKLRLSEEEESEPIVELEFPSNSYMVDQLLVEILIRLPNTCACRCKVVCKRWNSLISSNYFISRFNSHCKESQITPNSFSLLFQYSLIPRVVTESPSSLFRAQVISTNPMLSKSYREHYFNFNFLPRSRSKSKPECKHIETTEAAKLVEPFRVWTSCEDMFLCTYFAKYYVVNLLIKQWIMLPPIPNSHRPRQCSRIGLLCHHDANGFRFRVIVAVPQKTNSSLFVARVFCSELGQWTKLIVDWYPFTWDFNYLSNRMVSYNGMLHWINGERKELVSLDLFSNDPQLKLSQTIKLPDGFGSLSGIGVCQGHLRVSDQKSNGGIGLVLGVWDLEDYQKGVWRLVHQVVPSDSCLTRLGENFHFHFHSMSFHPYNKDIIFVYAPKHVYQYNIQTRKFEKYSSLKRERGFPDYRNLRHDVVLLHQWFPTPLSLP